MFYVGKQKISPGFFSKGESSGDVITAKNYTNANISAGDKVWINQKAYESGSSTDIGTGSYTYIAPMPDFVFYNDNGVIKRIDDNVSTGYSFGAYLNNLFIQNYEDGLVVIDYSNRGDWTVYYKNGQVLFNTSNVCQVINRPDLMIVERHLSKINPNTGEVLGVFTATDGSEFKFNVYHSLYVACSDTILKAGYDKWIFNETNMTVQWATGDFGVYRNVVGVTSDKKYYFSYDGSIRKWVTDHFEDVSNMFGTSYAWNKYILYRTTNLLTPKIENDSSELPTFKYYPETDTWEVVPVNRETLISNKIQFNDDMTQYAAWADSKCKIVNLQSFQRNSLYPFAQINMSRDTLTGVAKENIAIGEEGRVTTILP